MERELCVERKAQETYEMMKKLGDSPNVFATNCMIDFYNDAGLVK